MIKRLLIIRYPFPSPNILRKGRTGHHWGFLGNFLFLFRQWDVRFAQQCVCEHSRLSGQDTFSISKYLRIGAAYSRHQQGFHSAWCHIQQVLNLSWHMKQYFFIHFPWQPHVYSKLLGCKAKGKSLWSVTVLSRVAQLHAAMTDCPRQEDICEFALKLLVSWYVRTCRLVNGCRCFEGY